MGRIVIVEKSERAEVDGAQVLDVVIDPGGKDLTTAPHFGAPGDDSKPLPGDTAVTVETQGSGEEVVVGYLDEKNAGIAKDGERRIYARDSDGVVVAEVYIKADGSVLVKNDKGYHEIKADGIIEMNGSADNAVAFADLEVAFEKLKAECTTNYSAILTSIAAIVTAFAVSPVPITATIPPYVVVPLTADVGPSKVDTIKVP